MARTSVPKCDSVGRLSRGGPASATSRAMTGSRSARIRAAAPKLGELMHRACHIRACHIRAGAIRHGSDERNRNRRRCDMARIAVAGATGRVGRHVVDVLRGGGHDVVAISRSNGVDVITGDGLAAALEGVEIIIDTSTGPSAEQGPATEFFTTATGNLQGAGEKAGVRRLVVVSIIGMDKATAGYGAAKLAHEQAAL